MGAADGSYVPETSDPRRLIATIPSLATELATLLTEAEEPELAALVSGENRAIID
jgi:hypothetical protein